MESLWIELLLHCICIAGNTRTLACDARLVCQWTADPGAPVPRAVTLRLAHVVTQDRVCQIRRIRTHVCALLLAAAADARRALGARRAGALVALGRACMSTCADAAADLVALRQRVGALGAVSRRCTPTWTCAHALGRKHTLLAPSAHVARPRACVDAAVVQLAALVSTAPCSRFTGNVPLTAAHRALLAATVARCVGKLDRARRAVACMARLVTCVHATSKDAPTRRTARYSTPNRAEDV